MSTRLNPNMFDDVYNETYDDVLKYIICKCSNIVDANDILQEVYFEFYKILKKNREIVLDNTNAYLIGISQNKIKQYFGVKAKMQNLIAFSKDDELNSQELVSDFDLETVMLNKDNIQEIKNFVNSKKQIAAKIFYLYYYYEMPLKIIASELEMNESTVKSHLYRLLNEINAKFR